MQRKTSPQSRVRHSRRYTTSLLLQQLEPRVLMDGTPTPATFDRDPAKAPLMRSSIYTSPLRRIRPGDVRIPNAPDNPNGLNPPVLPGATKIVDLTFGNATVRTAIPLGI